MQLATCRQCSSITVYILGAACTVSGQWWGLYLPLLTLCVSRMGSSKGAVSQDLHSQLHTASQLSAALARQPARRPATGSVFAEKSLLYYFKFYLGCVRLAADTLLDPSVSPLFLSGFVNSVRNLQHTT